MTADFDEPNDGFDDEDVLTIPDDIGGRYV